MSRNLRALDDEIAWPLGGRFWPDPRISGRQNAIGKAGPVAANGGVEALPPLRIDRVIDAVHPLDVRTKAGLPRQIERQVDAETARLRDRVDEMTKRRPGAGEREVVALGEIFRRDRRAIEPAQAGGKLPGVESGGIDDEISLEFGGFASAGSEFESCGRLSRR